MTRWVGFGVLGVALVAMAFAVGILAAVIAGLACGCGYTLGWLARDTQLAESDALRDGMRVTAPLEQRHVHAIIAFGENSFGPMDLDDDHDEALEILRQHVRIPVREEPR